MSTLIRRVALCCSIVLCFAVSSFSQTSERTLGTYGYDGSGLVKSIGPDSAGLTNFYDYDSAGRLIRFIRKNVASGAVILTETFEYDAYGNLTKRTTNNVVTSLTADANTNRLTGASYNAAGDMTQYGGETYVFDPVGTLTQKSGSWGNAFYVYTADDERIGIAGPDGSWRYMGRDLNGKVLREWGAASWNGTLSWVEDYVYRDGQLAAASRPASQGGDRHFHLDHLGTPRLITGDDGSIYADHGYYPYGAEYTSPTQELDIGHDTPEPMKFTGHERDFAGSYTGPVLDYMHARYYSPGTGRFLSTDPVLQIGRAMRTPQLWNRYSYALNNPMVFTDPTGKTVYLVTYTTGNSDGDEEFRRAAMTRAAELRKQKGFDPKKDTVLVRGVGTKDDFRAAVKAANALAPKFGKVGEVSLFSHAGRADGPIFPGNRSSENQFTDGEMATIGVNWASGGCARFFGCNTGLNFTQRFANMQGVRAYGYTGYAGFSGSPNEFSMWGSKGPLYLIHTAGYSNSGVEGMIGKYLGYNDAAIPMDADDPDPQP